VDCEGRLYRLLLSSFSFWKEVKYRFTGPSHWSSRFISRSVHVIFLMDRVAVGWHSFLQILWCFPASTHSSHLQSNDVNIEMYRTVSLSVVLCG
jgi:hypothetical protein